MLHIIIISVAMNLAVKFVCVYHVRLCVRLCVHVCVRACVCVHEREREREREIGYL